MFLGNELDKDNESVDNLSWQENRKKTCWEIFVYIYQNTSNVFAILPSNTPLSDLFLENKPGYRKHCVLEDVIKTLLVIPKYQNDSRIHHNNTVWKGNDKSPGSWSLAFPSPSPWPRGPAWGRRAASHYPARRPRSLPLPSLARVSCAAAQTRPCAPDSAAKSGLRLHLVST